MQRNGSASWVIGFGLGAGFMYLMDSRRRRRNQALLRDKFTHLSKKSANMMSVGGRDLMNRTRGALAEAKSSFRHEHDITDDVIEDRVRSKMGRYVSHPHSIDVSSEDGIVTLKGLILNHEVKPLISALFKVKGVKAVNEQLRIHERDDNMPSLQGGRPRVGEKLDLFQSNWAPATRLLMTLAGSGLVLSAVGLGTLHKTARI